jgi:hypothetical protein
MITNQQPWQATVNPVFLTNVPQTQNTLSIVQKNFITKTKKTSASVVKFAAAKRYSFDDNGGGYQGL